MVQHQCRMGCLKRPEIMSISDVVNFTLGSRRFSSVGPFGSLMSTLAQKADRDSAIRFNMRKL